MQICKQAQQFFDVLYDEQNINAVVTNAFRDACIFDKGIIYVDRNSLSVKRVMPWQVFYDSYEYSYGHLTQIAWKQEQYPVSLLPMKVDRAFDTVTYWQYWNVNAGKKWYYIPELDYLEEEKWEPDAIPFIFINYASPVKSSSSSSVVDLLYGIQMEIDYLNTVIKDASQRGCALKFLVPENSNVKVSNLNNRAGQVITYTPIANQTTPPILAETDPFMDPQWTQLLAQYKQDAYEIVGISQLSATSQKPKGLNSGVALSTMEDIESDRFETQLNTVIRCYTDIAKMIIEVFPEEDNILPASKWRSNIQWKDIVEANGNFTVQFSAAEFLSKDPSVKIQQVQALQAMGQISPARAGLLLEIPDIQQGYSIQNNAMNAVLAIIDSCLTEDDFDIPDYIPTQILMEEILNTCLSLRAAGKQNEPDIQKLMALYSLAERKNQDAMTAAEMSATAGLGSALEQQVQSGIENGQLDAAMAGQPVSQ